MIQKEIIKYSRIKIKKKRKENQNFFFLIEFLNEKEITFIKFPSHSLTNFTTNY